MFYIDEDQNITLTRSDTARIELTVLNEAGETYDYSNDLTQFTVKRNTVTNEIIFQKTFTGGDYDESVSYTVKGRIDLYCKY